MNSYQVITNIYENLSHQLSPDTTQTKPKIEEKNNILYAILSKINDFCSNLILEGEFEISNGRFIKYSRPRIV